VLLALRARLAALAVLFLLVPGPAAAQPAGVVLVARPSIADPNFARTVIAVAQMPDGAAIGVIVNRPLTRSLAELVPDQPRLARFTTPLHAGGPVERNGLFALYVAPGPVGESLPIGGGMHLALLPPDVERLIDGPPARLRFFAGYSGWGPGQLAREIERGDWWVLDPDPDLALREDTRSLWDELRESSSRIRTRL
jgi:putative transcriptional regulator